MPTSINNTVDQPEKRNPLTNIRLKNQNRLIIWQLNINSVRNKFDFLCSEISPSLDLLLDSETKGDDSFPTVQFLMSGFCKPHRLDRCSNGGSLMLYIREDTPPCLLTEYKPPENVECLFMEIKIRKKKWLLCCSYNTHKNNISNHLHHLSKSLDVYLKHYNLLILGDLNSELKDFLMLTSLNKESTCFKNPNNPSCIDLFYTNRSRYFQNTSSIETGISDFHKLVVTVLKMFYKKQKPKINK